MQIGIMQGRLVPPTENRIQCFPRERWQDEFGLAAEAGLDAIEWIYDLYGADVNPIATDGGLARIRELASSTRVQVRSLCADYFMDRPLLRASKPAIDERVETLVWLLGRCGMLGISRVVLPFVDASAIDSDADLRDVAHILEFVLPVLDSRGVELHLETSLSPVRFGELLARVPHGKIKVNYDSGNSSSLGYLPVDEFAVYGARVGSVHIKDRVRGGGTVPLTTGDTDFEALFACLRRQGYEGDFVLQVARGPAGDEVAWARRSRDFVVTHVAGPG